MAPEPQRRDQSGDDRVSAAPEPSAGVVQQRRSRLWLGPVALRPDLRKCPGTGARTRTRGGWATRRRFLCRRTARRSLTRAVDGFSRSVAYVPSLAQDARREASGRSYPLGSIQQQRRGGSQSHLQRQAYGSATSRIPAHSFGRRSRCYHRARCSRTRPMGGSAASSWVSTTSPPSAIRRTAPAFGRLPSIRRRKRQVSVET